MPQETIVDADQTNMPLADGATPSGIEQQQRRRNNREFMRLWRTDPQHVAKEREMRRQRYYARKKQHCLDEKEPAIGRGLLSRTCRYCWRPATQIVVRLRICDHAPDGYVEVQTPYCGQC